MTALQVLKLFTEDQFVGVPCSKDQEDLAWPAHVRQIADHAHHGRHADAAGDQDDTFGVSPIEGEHTRGATNLQHAARHDAVVQEA